MTIYAYDTEFLEDGETIALISIGIVADDGREYYAVNRDAPWKRIKKHDWLVANVVPSLPKLYGDARLHYARRGPLGSGNPELWAYYGAYDHVALCQLWGRMIDLPDGIPMFTRDLQQEITRLDAEPPEQTGGQHNALDDARWVDASLRWLQSQRSPRGDT
jgi:hypothetical protein